MWQYFVVFAAMSDIASQVRVLVTAHSGSNRDRAPEKIYGEGEVVFSYLYCAVGK